MLLLLQSLIEKPREDKNVAIIPTNKRILANVMYCADNESYVNRTGGSAFCSELKKEAEDDGARDVLQEFRWKKDVIFEERGSRKKGDKVRKYGLFERGNKKIRENMV